jgi:hypothetical protein
MTDTELKPLRRASSRLVHGHTVDRKYSPTYHSWQAMLARCRYVGRDEDNKYAGRGISCCERWASFENFLSDMGERPSGKTLDRQDPNGDYHPGNCQWATPTEQARNRRNARLCYETAVAVALERLRGAKCSDIAARYGISESLPREIVKGRSWKDASTEAHKLFLEMTHV